MPEADAAIRGPLVSLYGEQRAESVLTRLRALLDFWRERIDRRPRRRFTERDAILITYGDMVRDSGEDPLATLSEFLAEHVADTVNTVHLLPFFRSSSDGGFSVIDYREVDPDLGGWDDVHRIGRRYALMIDAVINHVSAESEWFQGFLRDDPRYRDYFIVMDPDTDTTPLFRPRALPVVTEFDSVTGPRYVWTTFSSDQVDLNFTSPAVLLAIIDTLLFYLSRGADLLRLDAVAFVWKELGTPCVHLPQTHAIVRLVRGVLDVMAPGVSVVTETNFPHGDNVSYFGDGTDEAHMIYNFALPPLTLNAFHTGSARSLSQWAGDLAPPTKEVTFLNFLASHDGIGVGGARGLLTEAEIDQLALRVQQLNGYVSHKDNSDGTRSVYEMNINFLDALEDPASPEPSVSRVARRFLTSQAIMLALRGVPGIYLHSLLGSRGWAAGVRQTGEPRAINREKLHKQAVEDELSDEASLRHHVLTGFRHLLEQRASHPAFGPEAEQYVLPTHDSVFALLRVARDDRGFVLCLHNVSSSTCEAQLDLSRAPLQGPLDLIDLVCGGVYRLDGGTLNEKIEPYQTLWLTARADGR